MDEALYDEMFALEQRHWWFAAKRQIVLALLRRFLPAQSGPPARICDVGCGCGMMLHDLAAAGYDAVGLDSNDLALEYCRARGVQACRGVLPGELGIEPASVSCALLLDVLEHIDDDRGALGATLKLVRPGGILIATVPAHPWLWTTRDVFHHHRRRYRMREFRQMVAMPGAEVLRLTYLNSLLFGPALAVRLIEGWFPRKKPQDLKILPLGINSLLRSLLASERLPVLRGWSLPWGLSILAVLRKTQESQR